MTLQLHAMSVLKRTKNENTNLEQLRISNLKSYVVLQQSSYCNGVKGLFIYRSVTKVKVAHCVVTSIIAQNQHQCHALLFKVATFLLK